SGLMSGEWKRTIGRDTQALPYRKGQHPLWLSYVAPRHSSTLHCEIVSYCARTMLLFRSAYVAHLVGQAKRRRSSFWSRALISAEILEKSLIEGLFVGSKLD
ncbi:MAG: hypothetical protein PHO89_06780, partial [Methylacidiphilaceae bacterium]|nr:hypothetical protein [Candidatus Methylacidiphilaceae bacterium]